MSHWNVVSQYDELRRYTFLQHDHTNWMHPIGFAYDPDGAHRGNDELEPGVTRGTTSCDTSNTCQKPMYYKNGVYLADPADSEDFGLDAYEPKFKNTQDEWGEALWSVKLVLDDATYDGDIFYLCHIHDMMSGRIKLLDASDRVIQAQDIPELGYEYHTPSPADALCGTTDLAPFMPGGTHHDFCMDSKYLCEEGPTYDVETQHFNQCLKVWSIRFLRIRQCTTTLGLTYLFRRRWTALWSITCKSRLQLVLTAKP